MFLVRPVYWFANSQDLLLHVRCDGAVILRTCRSTSLRAFAGRLNQTLRKKSFVFRHLPNYITIEPPL